MVCDLDSVLLSSVLLSKNAWPVIGLRHRSDGNTKLTDCRLKDNVIKWILEKLGVSEAATGLELGLV